MKIKIFSKETCLKKAREEYPHITDEQALLDYLPDDVFDRVHEATGDVIGEQYKIIFDKSLWCVPAIFAEIYAPEESFDFKRDCKHTNYEIACGINNLCDSDFIEVFAELGILNGKTLGETVKWLGEVLEEIRMAQCEEV